MKWDEIKHNIIENYDIAKILYDVDNCYFYENVMIDQIDQLNPAEKQQTSEDYSTMGCIIQNNNVYFPAKLPFRLELSSKGDPNAYYITRKGIDAGIYWPEEFEVSIELTEVGKKCLALSKELHTTTINAYEIVKTIEHIFGVSIIKE